MTQSVSILPLGACLLHGPLAAAKREGKPLAFNAYGRIGNCYTVGAMLQVIATMRGECDVPKEIRPLCGMKADAGQIRGAETFADVDMALLEPASTAEINFRGYSLNRNLLMGLIVEPVRTLGPEISKAAIQWVRTGLEGVNPTVAAEAGRAIVGALPPEFRNRELIEAVLLETRSTRGDMLEGFRTMREVVNRPIGVVAYVFRYLADGRAISWPGGFVEEVKDAARRLEMPILEPADHVRNYPGGVAAALKPDLRHYSGEFNSIMADVIIEFCQGVRDGARSPAA